eukprot:7737995-Pyramimonas_sp.AAC.2
MDMHIRADIKPHVAAAIDAFRQRLAQNPENDVQTETGRKRKEEEDEEEWEEHGRGEGGGGGGKEGG